MSTTDGDAKSRLENALADVFENAPSLPPRDASPSETTAANPVTPSAAEPASAADDDWDVDGPDDDEPYTLPEIVPATTHAVTDAAAVSPPASAVVPAPAAPSSPQPSPPSSPQPSAPVAARPAPAPAASTAPTTAWGDHLTNATVQPQAQLRTPGRRPRVRKVTRVLRHIDPWSTFKVGLVFSMVAYLVALTSGVLLWRVADSTGTLDNVERWFTQFGWETFELKGGEIFHNAWIIGLFGAVALTGALVLLATLFNLVSDIVGGIRMTVLEEEVVERTQSSARRYVVRRAPVDATGADTDQSWDIDDDDSPASAPSTGAKSATAPAPDNWSVDDDDDRADEA